MKFFTRSAVMCAVMAAGSAAFASSDLAAPDIVSVTDPSNWRIVPGQLFNGVAALDGVALLSGGCTGSLLAGGQYVLTAAHCVGTLPKAGNFNVDFGVQRGVPTLRVTASRANVTVNPLYAGGSTYGADLALIKLNTTVSTIQGYQLSTTNDVGKQVLLAGYGVSGLGTSTNLGSAAEYGYGHYGYNNLDITVQQLDKGIADSNLAPGWTYDPAQYIGATYIYDFDDGTANHNTVQRVGAAVGTHWASSLGLGNAEADIAPGDSGGGAFVWDGSQWLLSAVHSFGVPMNTRLKDGICDAIALSNCDDSLDNTSSFGDMAGSTGVFSQLGWISTVTGQPVPEPQTWLLALGGAGLLVLARRRRKAQ